MPIAQNSIRPAKKLTALISVFCRKRACVSTTDAMPQSAAEAEPSTTGKGNRALGSFFKIKAVPPPSFTMQL